MARQRFISPPYFIHKLLFTAEKKSRLPLRVAFAGLWTQADRRGIFRWKPDDLKLAILPYDKVDMGVVLDSLAAYLFIVRYEIGGKSYGIIPTFAQWQTFHHREMPSKDPAPSESWLASVLARGQPGASPTVAVTVTGTDAVTVTAPREEHDRAAADRSDAGASALGTREVVKILGASKRMFPNTPARSA